MSFKTDGCTRWPDRWFGVEIDDCCLAHDLDYWVQDVNKWGSDWRLARCVARHLGGPKGLTVAALMWLGVSTFGWRYWLRGKRGERPQPIDFTQESPARQRAERKQNHQGGPGASTGSSAGS